MFVFKDEDFNFGGFGLVFHIINILFLQNLFPFLLKELLKIDRLSYTHDKSHHVWKTLA